MRKKLLNSKGYAESTEFLPAQKNILLAINIIIFIKKKSVATTFARLQKNIVLINIKLYINEKLGCRVARLKKVWKQEIECFDAVV